MTASWGPFQLRAASGAEASCRACQGGVPGSLQGTSGLGCRHRQLSTPPACSPPSTALPWSSPTQLQSSHSPGEPPARALPSSAVRLEAAGLAPGRAAAASRIRFGGTQGMPTPPGSRRGAPTWDGAWGEGAHTLTPRQWRSHAEMRAARDGAAAAVGPRATSNGK